MSIDTAIYALLTGGGIARVYPPPIPDNPTYPLVTYAQVSGVRGYVMEGADGLVIGRFQVDCWDPLSSAARTLAETVRLILSGYRGTSDDMELQSVFLFGETKMFDDAADLHRVMQEYRIFYREAMSLST